MALRPFVTAGVAFAAAGAVAATVAIAPPMSPGEVRVAQKTEEKLALTADTRDLINTFFGQFPGDPDNSGTTGVAGVVQQLLQNANVNDPQALEVIDGLFGSGFSEVARIFLTRYGADPVTNAQINIFFNQGLSELVRYRLLAFNGDPQQRFFINTLFGQSVNNEGDPNISQNGFSGLAYNFIVGTGLSLDQRRIIDTFWNAGTPYNSQAVPVFEQAVDEDDNPIFDEDGNPVYVQATDEDGVPIVDANGDPVYVIAGYTGNSNPARRGAFGVLYNQIVGTGISPDQQATLDQLYDGGFSEIARVRLVDSTSDPEQKQTINDFFGGGISEVVRTRLLAGATGDPNRTNLINEFFDNGISGVVRYLLVGPVPEEEDSSTTPPNDEEPTATLRVASTEPKAEEKTPEVTTQVAARSAKVEAPVQTAPVQEAAPASTPAPASTTTSTSGSSAPAEAVSAPAPAPAPEPAKSTSSTKTKEAEPAAEETNVKSGNKVEPEIIIPGGGGGNNGSGSWGILGDIAQAVVNHVTGGGAAGGGTTSGGGTDSGSTGGSGSGSSSSGGGSGSSGGGE